MPDSAGGELVKRIDLFYKLLFVFALAMVTQLIYMGKMYALVRNYNLYHTKAQEMILGENRWEKIYTKRYRHIDGDSKNRLLEIFKKNIHFLKNSKLKKEFGVPLYKTLVDLEMVFKEKCRVLEKFEELNAQVNNSIGHLHDIRKRVKNIAGRSEQEKRLFRELPFFLNKEILGLPLDRERLASMLKELSALQEKNSLYRHTHQYYLRILEGIKEINALIVKNNSLRLDRSIDKFITALRQKHAGFLESQKAIALSFVFSIFFLMALLAIYYHRVQESTKRLRAFRYAVENSDNTIVLTDAERRIEYANDTFEKNTGYTKAEVIGKNPKILKSGLVKESVFKEMNETLARGKKWKGELINRRKDGTLLYESVSIVPIFLDQKLVQYLAVKLDITHYVQQQKILQQSAVVYDAIDDGIAIFDSKQRIVSFNSAFGRMFGYESVSQGRRLHIMNLIEREKSLYRMMMSSLSVGGRWSRKVNGITKDGEIVPVWLKVASVKDKKGEVQNYVAIYVDLQEIIEMEERVDYLAYHDTLTQLPNRREFKRKLNEVIEQAKRSQKKIALLFIDLDRFKGINDTLGHHIGDEILVVLSQRIAGLLEKEEMLARIGGDEFVLISEVKSGEEHVAQRAEKVLDVIRKPIFTQNYYLHISASIGIAIYPDDGVDQLEIIKHADAAMYDAKEKGKDRYRFYTRALSLNMQKRLQLEQELLYAHKRGEFSLYYQPKYLLGTRKINGVEALLRWTNPILGKVSPHEFIVVAEETGLIEEIGYYVFEEACKAFVRWKKEKLGIERISINVSSIQFREEGFVEQVSAIASDVGVDTASIDIEVTERFVVEDAETDHSILKQLHALGFGISIDDFGTGYSSISYLKDLPVETIKIDKSFVGEVSEKMHDLELLQAIVALGKSLGYHIVAEGIETKRQEFFLREIGVDTGQGYLFAKPMPEEDFIDFCRRQMRQGS